MNAAGRADATVVVTGAAAGIGKACAELAMARGWRVIGVDRDLAEPIAERGALTLLRADVADAAALDAAWGLVAERAGNVAGLVCAAGVIRYGTVEETSPALFQEVFAINVGGVFNACRTVLPALRANGGGSIVLVSSVQAFVPQTSVAAYAASKGALVTLARQMALDYSPLGIRTNVLCPGSVDTPMLRNAARRFAGEEGAAALVAEWGASHPIGRMAQASEIASAALFLLSEEASFISGADLRVDGALGCGQAVALPDPVDGEP